MQMENLFKKFYPNKPQEAKEFSESLPEFKLSMAKLQGHFLKYRDQPQETLDNAQELMQSHVELINEMSVGEWLMRLNLIELAPKMAQLNMVQITDLKVFLDEKKLDELKVEFKYPIHKARFNSMIQGKDQITLADFKLITVQTAKQILGKFIKNKSKFEELSSYLEDNVMSAFQLRDVLTFNNDFNSIKSELESYIKMCKDFKDMTLMDIQVLATKQIEKKELEMKIAQEKQVDLTPSYSIEKLLSKNKLKDAYKMVQENNIDSEAFWSLDDTQVKEILKVEAYGDRKHLVTVMAEIKLEHVETEK